MPRSTIASATPTVSRAYCDIRGGYIKSGTRSHLEGCGVDNHSTRGKIAVTFCDCLDNGDIFDSGVPKGEGGCHAGRPGSDNEDSCS
jgi:hypothetical protein